MISFDILQNLTKGTRTNEDNLNIYDWFKRKIDLFKNLSLNTVIEILDNGKLIEKQYNEIIIRQGEYGENFFVMIKGSASIYINTDLNISQMEEQMESSTPKKPLKSASLRKPHKGVTSTVKSSDRKVLGEFVGKYEAGSCFGELALIQKECIRNASIISDETVYVLSINRDLFNNSLRSFTESLYQDKISFVTNCFLFKNWMPRLKYQIAMSLIKESYDFGQEIIVQGQESNGLVILKKGFAKAIIDIKQQVNQYNAIIGDQVNGKSSHDPQMKGILGHSQQYKGNQLQKEVAKNIKTDKYEVAILGENYIIGDIEYCFDICNNLFTIIATENCEVYRLRQVHLDRMISARRNTNTFNVIQNLATAKLKIYYNRCSAIFDLPLFKYVLEEIDKSYQSENSVSNTKASSVKYGFKPIFPPGPVIDFYGPGSVFFRNRLKRETLKIKTVTRNQWHNSENWKNEFKVKYQEKPEKIPSKSIDQLQIFPRSIPKSIDWETGSQHLQSLESRLNTWMENIPVNNKPWSGSSNKFTILKLPRFKTEFPSKNFRAMKVLDKKTSNHSLTERSIRGPNHDNNMREQKNMEMTYRQYTELDYRQLKKEMNRKEKKLAVFRLTNAI